MKTVNVDLSFEIDLTDKEFHDLQLNEGTDENYENTLIWTYIEDWIKESHLYAFKRQNKVRFIGLEIGEDTFNENI